MTITTPPRSRAGRVAERTPGSPRRTRATGPNRPTDATDATVATGSAGVLAPPKPDTNPTERTSGRTRSAAAQRAYARRAQREGRPHERAAGQADSATGRASFVVLIIVLLVVGVAATLWLSTQAIADSYRLEEAKKQATDLAEHAAELQREVTKAESASALAEQARQMGMVPAGDPARLIVQPDGTVVVVGEPKPAQTSAPPAPPAPPAAPPAAPRAPADQPNQQNQPNQPPDQAAAPPGGG